MSKKFKHRLVIDVTFNQPVTEKQAFTLFAVGLDKETINDQIDQYFIVDQPNVSSLQVKRWSRVLPHVLPSS